MNIHNLEITSEKMSQHQRYKSARERMREAGRKKQRDDKLKQMLLLAHSPEPEFKCDLERQWIEHNERIAAKKAAKQAKINKLKYDNMKNAVPLDRITVREIQEICLSRGFSDGKTTVMPNELTLDDILGDRRTRNVIVARHAAMYFCVKQTQLSYPAMGRLFGNRDHTTLLHSKAKMDALIIDGKFTMDGVVVTKDTELSKPMPDVFNQHVKVFMAVTASIEELANE